MSLQVWLPLINDIHNQGTSSCIPESSGISTDIAGKIGSCQYLSGAATSYINTNYSTNIGTNDFSIAMWLKLPTISSGSYFAICSSKTAAGASAGFGIYWNYSQKKFLWSTADGSAGTEIWMATAVDSIVYDKWIHLVMVRNNNDSKKGYFYINGTRYELTSVPAIRNITTDTKMHIGKCTNGSYPTKMYINDFRIYDHALSAAEIHEIAQGLVLHYKLDTLYPASPIHIDSTINDTAYNSSISKYGYNTTSNLAKTSGVFQGKQCIKVSTITAGQNAQPYAYFSNLFTSNGTNQPAYKRLEFDYYTTCPTTTWLNIYKLGSGTGTASWTTQSSAGTRSGMYTNSESGHNLLVVPNEWNHVSVVFHGDTDANAEWGYCINGPTHVSNANYYFLYANIEVTASSDLAAEDSSGYGHHGTSFGSLISTAETGRYASSTKLNSSSPTDNTETGITYILSPLALTTPNQMTVAWWAKPESGYGGGTGHAAFCTSVNSRPTDYNATAMHHRDAGFDLCPNSGSSIRLTFNQYTANQWHHYAITYDGQKATAYKDGVALTNTSMAAAGPLKSFNNIWIGYSQAGGVKRKTLGSYSDFRVYVTSLSAADILELYHTGAKIDNKANFHTYEINENGTNKLTKTGIMYDNMEESIMTLPDGSHWQLLMFHYVDDGKNLFTSSNANNCNDFGLFSRLKDIDGFKLNNQYEFYAIQDDTTYRWIQTNAPLTTTAVTGFSAVSGYNSPGAGICKCSGNTLLARTNSTGNWWNAMGCYTIYNNGIPGFNSIICKKYMALYARIEKADVKLSNQTANASEFLEL